MVTTSFLYTVRWIAIVLLCFPITTFAEGGGSQPDVPERVVWRKTPIDILLVVGEERLVHFPASVSIGLPQLLTPLLRSQSI
ncbi:MAG: TIGR03749 family integrating conjugative element protein, partial [Gammaproteobacteria bacterium]